jgi:hypothetical protein
MEDLRTRAQLVEFEPARAGAGAIGTVVDRVEFAETAARGEYPATFLLDLDRIGTDGGEVTAQATVALDWDKDTIDRLLASTDDPEIALWFDEDELARAFEEGEVEAHGLRERAAVLAVAVAAAGTAATPALARIAPDVGGMGGGQPAVSVTHQTGGTTIQPMGAERALQQDKQISVAGGGGLSSTAQPMGVERTMQQDEQISVPAPGTTAGAPEATPSGGSGPSSGEIATIAGVGALLISAAGFGVTRKRMRPVQPA